MSDFLRPGSTEAIKAGCECPVLDNRHGWGYIVEGQYVWNLECPLHYPPVESIPDDLEGAVDE